jgi:hypothetical protein
MTPYHNRGEPLHLHFSGTSESFSRPIKRVAMFGPLPIAATPTA